MYVLDTNVVSELRKARLGKADANVVAWAESVDAGDLYLSAITVMELELGVLAIERKDASQGAMLRAWLQQQVLPEFAERILPVDTTVAQRCARLHIPNKRGERDALIAAVAARRLDPYTAADRLFAGASAALAGAAIPLAGSSGI